MKRNKHEGSNFFDYLKESGMSEEIQEYVEKESTRLRKKRDILGKIKNYINILILSI